MKFAHKLTLALLVVLAVVLSLCNTVLIGQQFRQNDRSGAQQGMVVRQHHARLAILGKQGFHFG